MITRRERLRKRLKHLRNSLLRRPGSAVPVLIFGEQRSGTNMLLRCFGRCPSTAMYNETDEDAFVDYELRCLEEVRRLIARSPATHVVLKPTADGNRADEIADALPGSRVVWIYRDYRDAVSSALALFRETSLVYLANVVDRSPAARWRAINVTADDIVSIRRHLQRGLSEESARALIWAIRNDFFFRCGMHERSDVLLLGYEELVRDPVAVVQRAYDFVGLPFNEEYTHKVFSSSIGRRASPEIDAEIAAICAGVLGRLDEYRLGQRDGSPEESQSRKDRSSGHVSQSRPL